MSYKNSLFLFGVLLAGLNQAQPQLPQVYFSDLIQLPSDTLNSVFYAYKIPLNHLVFEKEADLFLAQYRISVEVFDALSGKFITRSIKEKTIQVPDYEQTRSPLIFSEGILDLKLDPGTYSVMEILYDYKSDRELKMLPREMKFDSLNAFISPLIIDEQSVTCKERLSAVLANYGGNLPFDEAEYSFVIPVKAPEKDSLYIKLIQDKDTIYNGVLSHPEKGGISLSECGGKVILNQNSEVEGYDSYLLSGISGRIREGAFRIIVSDDPGFSHKEDYQFLCKWINKPVSLKDPELAISALKFIEKDSVISSLLSSDEEDYSRNLAAYWKKIDPTPSTEFNPLMQEFYTRIDYAVKNFATIAGANGANTDRGKIYIKYGKPVNIERTSDNYGYVIETWTYNNPQRKFVFVDKKGTGDFSLING